MGDWLLRIRVLPTSTAKEKDIGHLYLRCPISFVKMSYIFCEDVLYLFGRLGWGKTALQANRVEEERRGRRCKQATVEAVEHAPVARKHVAAVLDAQLALEEAFYEVAPCAKHACRQGEAIPME